MSRFDVPTTSPLAVRTMTIAPGSRLGPYEITGKLGEGGMGEVWRATDSKLKREVAIKVLPAAFTEDTERLARFEREAQLLAQLHHPNIASIFGLEESGGVRALVMELVEGPTLDERMKAGRLPLEESLSIARQIAEALEEAHEKGIVHRDLKPQNVKAPVDGKVKVLDFGLAKAMDPPGASSAADLARSPTIMNSPTMTAAHGTQLGVILGTAAYMSPEQARGGAVDKRADIWAFGVVLYEMLSGRSLFAAETVSDTLACVLKTEVDFATLPAATPPALRQLLRRCLERNPKHRLHDIADARLVLDDLIAGRPGDDARAPVAAPAGRTARSTAGWVAALFVVGAAAAFAGYLANRRGLTPTEPLRLTIQLSANQELVVGANSTFAFSPDGGSLVFPGRTGGRQTLFRRELGEREAVSIPGTDGADAPFFSRDGQWIGFVSGGKLMKVAVAGGRPFRIAEQASAGSTWLGDGTIVTAPNYAEGLFRVPAAGGTPERLTTPDGASGELGHWWPDLLPGDRKVIFTAFRTPVDKSRIGILDLSTREVKWVVEGFFGRWVSTGHLLYALGQRLYALPFDPVTGTATGAAVAVLDDVLVSQTSGFAMAAVSSRGMLVYVSESLGNPLRELVWLDRAGRATPAIGERRRFLSASLSPDDRQAALTIQGESRDLWTYNLERATLSRLTSGEGTEFDPVWSRDGRELFYVFDSPPFELHRIPVGAPDSGRPIWDEPPTVDTLGLSVSPDGRTLAYRISATQTGSDLYSRPIDGTSPARPIRASRARESNVSFSPDGRWVSYQSNETGRFEVYAEPFPGPGERVQLSSDGGTDPLWALSGEIFYLRDDEVRVVATRLTDRAAFEAPRPLFRFPIVPGADHDAQTYDVTADGKRFLAVTIPEGSRPQRMEIVTDWARELARLAPGDGR
ncbi:MAG: protein kinase [Holophagales bacterium]|nr:protein kinase [Holophagales bacterium]